MPIHQEELQDLKAALALSKTWFAAECTHPLWNQWMREHYQRVLAQSEKAESSLSKPQSQAPMHTENHSSGESSTRSWSAGHAEKIIDSRAALQEAKLIKNMPFYPPLTPPRHTTKTHNALSLMKSLSEQREQFQRQALINQQKDLSSAHAKSLASGGLGASSLAQKKDAKPKGLAPDVSASTINTGKESSAQPVKNLDALKTLGELDLNPDPNALPWASLAQNKSSENPALWIPMPLFKESLIPKIKEISEPLELRWGLGEDDTQWQALEVQCNEALHRVCQEEVCPMMCQALQNIIHTASNLPSETGPPKRPMSESNELKDFHQELLLSRWQKMPALNPSSRSPSELNPESLKEKQHPEVRTKTEVSMTAGIHTPQARVSSRTVKSIKEQQPYLKLSLKGWALNVEGLIEDQRFKALIKIKNHLNLTVHASNESLKKSETLKENEKQSLSFKSFKGLIHQCCDQKPALKADMKRITLKLHQTVQVQYHNHLVWHLWTRGLELAQKAHHDLQNIGLAGRLASLRAKKQSDGPFYQSPLDEHKKEISSKEALKPS